MTLKILIKDGTGTGHTAGVSHAGELIISGIGDNVSKYVHMLTLGTPYNFFSPKPGYEFFITTIIASGPATANLSIYESDTSATSTISRLIIKFDFRITKLLIIPLPFGGFFRVNEGSFINAIATQANVYMTIIGFYKEVHRHKDT